MEQYYEIWQRNEIETYVRRMKEVDEATDLSVLKSDKLLWELQKERMEAEIEAWREGRPTCECPTYCIRFFRAMGLAQYDYPSSADEIAETPRYAEYKRALESKGYPEKACERAMLPVIMAELGDFPKPNLQINTGHGCDLHKFQRKNQATHYNIPVFYIDIPLNEDDKPHLSDLDYIADQLMEFIEWAESKVPSLKYDAAKHKEIVELDAIGERYQREIYQLIKHVPCPIGPLDGRRKLLYEMRPSRFPNMKKSIEYLRICRDELGERVVSGHCPEEELRLLWAGQVPQKKVLDVGKLFMKRKIASPFKGGGRLEAMTDLRVGRIGEMSEYGVKLTPFQEDARGLQTTAWGGPGKRWANSTLSLARDIGAQGIIHYLTIGCTPHRSLGTMVAERAEKELGIPTLNIEGRLQDRDYMSIEQFDEILTPFIAKCLEWAGKRRQQQRQ